MNSRSSLQLTFLCVFILFIFPLSGASNTFEDDIKKLSIFQAAFDQMYLEMGEIKTSATRHETGHFSNVESDKIENLLFRYLVLRRSIWDIINKYRNYNIYSDYPNENMKALLVGYASALTLYKYSGILITKNMGDDQVIDKLNEAYFRSDILRGSFREVYHSLTNLENLDKLDIARELITTEMDEPGTPLNLLIMDPTYGPLITNLESLHYTHVKLREEILNHFILITPELNNRLRHSTVKKKVEKLIHKAGGRFKA